MAVTDPPGFTVLTLGRNYQSIGDSPFSCSLWEAMLFELQVTNLYFFCFDSVARNHSFNVRLLKQSLIDYGPENHQEQLFELQVTNLYFFCFDSVARNHSFNVRLLKQSLIDYGPENHQEQYFSCPRRNNNPKRLSRSEGQNMNRSSFFFDHKSPLFPYCYPWLCIYDVDGTGSMVDSTR